MSLGFVIWSVSLFIAGLFIGSFWEHSLRNKEEQDRLAMRESARRRSLP